MTAGELAAIHMPPTSFWPIVLAIAMAVMISGLLISTYQVIVGGLLTLYCMYKFAMELHRPAEGQGHEVLWRGSADTTGRGGRATADSGSHQVMRRALWALRAAVCDWSSSR